MKPETEHRIPVLDGWRGLAILAVLFAHFFTAEVVNLGRFGVELFFVLSGRLMADILFVRRTPLLIFFPRRFSRVYPALFCFVVVIWVVSQLSGWFDIPSLVALAGLLFAMNYTAIAIEVSPAIDHLWSLAIEEHCYVLLGLLAALGRVRPRLPVLEIIAVLAGLAVLNGVAQTYGLGHRYRYVYWRTDVRGASILMSVVVYLWWRRGDTLALLRHPMAPVLLWLVGLALNLRAVPDTIKYSLGTLCLAVAVATIEQVPRPVAVVLRSRVLTLAGLGSFSLYLWQQPFYTIENAPWRYASLAAVVVIAWASYNRVEQPARRALNRWLTPHLHPEQPAAIAVGNVQP